METVKMLEARVQSCINELESLTPGTDEHAAKVEEIDKLVGSIKELRTVEIDEEDKFKNYELKVEQMNSDKKSKRFDHVISTLTLASSLVVAYATFRFDEKGTITSTLGRNILNKFIPGKK